MKLILLIMSLFLISGCSQKEALVQKEYVTKQVPKLRVMKTYPKLYIKYYPLDNIWYKVKKVDVYRASKRAMQRLQQNKIYTLDAKTFNELYHDKAMESVEDKIRKYL